MFLRARSGGVEGNERLTATAAVALLVLLAIEGVTILSIRSLLSMHVFVGIMLIPPWNAIRFEDALTGPPSRAPCRSR
jgi:hypothetical protein